MKPITIILVAAILAINGCSHAQDTPKTAGVPEDQNKIIKMAKECEFTTPPKPKLPVEPTVEKTIEFINKKLSAPQQHVVCQLGYIKQIQRFVMRYHEIWRPNEMPAIGNIAAIAVFDPALLNPEKATLHTSRSDSYGKIIKTYRLVLHTTDNQLVVLRCEHISRQRGIDGNIALDKGFGFPVPDEDDAEKLSAAFKNLITAYGGKAELF